MNQDLIDTSFDRRGLFRIGGLTLAGAAIVAACGDSNATQPGEVGRVGIAPPTPTLLDPIINNGVLLRTSASFETSIADAYQHMLDKGLLDAPSPTFPDLGNQSDLVKTFLGHHRQAAESFNQLAQEAGEEAWLCGNPRLDSAFITPIFVRVEDGAPATATAQAIPPSDDPTRDMVNLVVTLELLSAATSQALMPQVTESSFRAEAMRQAVRSARQSAQMSLQINPGAYVTPADAAAANPAATVPLLPTTTAPPAGTVPQTEIPLPIALPGQYGSLAPIVYIGGAGDENGVRLKLNFETPSTNSFVYPFDSCS
jgi:hypothetical protein